MGSTVDLFCANCGAACPPHARFCPACGHALKMQRNEGQQSTSKPDGSAVPDVARKASIVPPPKPKSRQKSQVPAASPQIPPPVRPGARPTTVLPAVTLSSSSIPLAEQVPLKERYRLVREIGSGGYGVVYKAMDLQFGNRLVAVKEMSQRGMNPEEIISAGEAFKREAFLLAGLTHPGLPSIYDYFVENDRWYLVMSFIEGETLEAYLNRSQGYRLPAEKVLQICTQLAAVLSYLHGRRPPIVFRDLKPSNIMRTYDGQIYLIDFGIARHFKPGQLKDTIALGSPGYAAPEQYGRTQSTPQADVYGLGVTMHQMLSGLDPAQFAFNLPVLTIPEYPQLSILIACMLEIDPKKRPASMGNIKRELHRISTRRTHIPANTSNQPGALYLPAPRRTVPPVQPSYPPPPSERYERY